MTHPKLIDVAKALAARGGSDEDEWECYLPDARAAVQALLEPDKGMVKAGVMVGWFQLWSTPERGTAETYKAMLKPLLEN